jgi:YbgC/YbaW family acyl-CoA thioester hydrolase
MFKYLGKVFGYQCDIYGHVNNAMYLHFLEEARSFALDDIDMSIVKMNNNGIQMFIKHYDIDFIKAIQLYENFVVKTNVLELDRVKSKWSQKIYNSKNELCLNAKIVVVFARNGKVTRISRELFSFFKENLM